MSQSMPEQSRDVSAVAAAAWHGVFWLSAANAVGVGIAVLLLFPSLNRLLAEWTYGRWIMVHMNLMLFGWTCLPLVGFLFRVYGADRGWLAAWCRPALWAWSAALGAGVLSWLGGHSSGKLFLDWSGYARIVFPLAMLGLWCLLALAFALNWRGTANQPWAPRGAKLLGLAVLLAVPLAMYLASSPDVYPFVNPDTGGPTGQSQLESSLGTVLIVLVLPYGIARRGAGRARVVALSWAVLVAEFALCFALGRHDVSHRSPAQFLSLGSLLLWIPLVPAYYAAFEWHAATRRWRTAFLVWWAVLLVTGWVSFLPGVLDRLKFTDGLVAHSFIAMAGCTSSLLIVVMIQLMGEDGRIFNRTRSYIAWNGAVAAYVLLMTVAGWIEGGDPAFTIVPGVVRNVIYGLRLLTGLVMLLASLDWLADATSLMRAGGAQQIHGQAALEKTA